MNEPKDKLMDPRTPPRRFLPPRAGLQTSSAAYKEGYEAGQKDQAPAAVALAGILGVTGFLGGAGLVGALVAIF